MELLLTIDSSRDPWIACFIERELQALGKSHVLSAPSSISELRKEYETAAQAWREYDKMSLAPARLLTLAAGMEFHLSELIANDQSLDEETRRNGSEKWQNQSQRSLQRAKNLSSDSPK